MAQETNMLARLGNLIDNMMGMLTGLSNLIDNIIERMNLLEERVNNVERWTKQISKDIINVKIEKENSCYQPIIDDLDDNNPPKGDSNSE